MNQSFALEKPEITPYPASETSRAIAFLREQGANCFDPVRFRYIEAMARRTLQYHEPVSGILETKLIGALTDYQARFEKARATAAGVVEHVVAHYPDSAETVQRLFTAGDFNNLTRYLTRLETSRCNKSLTDLTGYVLRDAIDQVEDGLGEKNSELRSFDEMLHKQEKDALVSHLSDTLASVDAPRREFGELKSMRLFRQAWVKTSANKRVAQTINKAPENAGPLNSHKLIIQSLILMRDISPDYLNRFMSYADTLLWLDQVVGKVAPPAEKVVALKKTNAKR